MFHFRRKSWFALSFLMLVAVSMAALPAAAWQEPALAVLAPAANAATLEAAGEYVVVAWNDLGMHCYNRDFRDLAVLPPYNTLWAQVIKVGDPPQIVTTGIRVVYSFADNAYSVGKSNFWDTSPYRPYQNAQWLFRLSTRLPNNIGLTGVGMSGTMTVHGGDHFEAVGIPITEFRDSKPTTPYPYQIATVVVYDLSTGMEIARTQPVAPVSTEMRCDKCHYDGGAEDIATGRVETNILALHDKENMEEYPPQYSGPLMNRRPVLCAWCHASNALEAPGVAGIPNLSQAMHGNHAEADPQEQAGCYDCHPGPQTQCLRDVMSTQGNKVCEDCHGTLAEVSQGGRNPWLEEPTCTDVGCHDSAYQQDQPLYRMSKDHGDVYCAACHDSPHAIAPSREYNDSIKFIGWQGHNGPVDTCVVCHASWPTDSGPHGMEPPLVRTFSFDPDRFAAREPGSTAAFSHTLHNKGNLVDTYNLEWTTSRGWASVSDGAFPLTLLPGESAQVQVTVTIPSDEGVRGQTETTVLTVTSQSDPALVETVTDKTMVPVGYVYLPLIYR